MASGDRRGTPSGTVTSSPVDFVARHRQRPFFVEKQIRAQDGGIPARAIALMQPVPQRDAGLAQNAGQIAEGKMMPSPADKLAAR